MHFRDLFEKHRHHPDANTLVLLDGLLAIATELHELRQNLPAAEEVHFSYEVGPVSDKTQPSKVMNIKLTNEQKILVWLQPVTSKGKPVALDGVPEWKVTAGNCTVRPRADGLACLIISGDEAGDSEITVSADADLGAGVRTISDAIRVTVNGAEAQSLGLATGEPTDKTVPDPTVDVPPAEVPASP